MQQNKQQEFNDAMQRYHNNSLYGWIYKCVSFINISLEIYLFSILFSFTIEPLWFIIIILVSYFLTDFINALVHLYMDNNDSYHSIVGPFIASFHLHHKTPRYKTRNVFLIYFNESGTKFWLVFYLLLVLLLSFMEINEIVLSILISVGILSSFAELSHYLCHNSNSKIVRFMQKTGVLLSVEHHKVHHNDDNVSYAFLNGMSDTLVDKIACKFYKGYKKESDTHYQNYSGNDTLNRI